MSLPYENSTSGEKALGEIQNTAEPSEYRQSYAVFEPQGDGCEHFLPAYQIARSDKERAIKLGVPDSFGNRKQGALP